MDEFWNHFDEILEKIHFGWNFAILEKLNEVFKKFDEILRDIWRN